ncbi:MAG: heme-binding protein [Magnetospirillum sp.]|nr:heme-binding protein [Magnetospirillum sp.]
MADVKLTIGTRSISSAAAFVAVGAAVDKGLEIGCRLNAAVVDAGGNLLAFRRADGAFLHSIAIAQDKAYTAAGFGMATTALYEAVKEPAALRDGIMLRERIVLFGGGYPIVVDGEVVGGIGCSGGSEEQDSICAQAGLAAIGL